MRTSKTRPGSINARSPRSIARSTVAAKPSEPDVVVIDVDSVNVHDRPGSTRRSRWRSRFHAWRDGPCLSLAVLGKNGDLLGNDLHAGALDAVHAVHLLWLRQPTTRT